MMVFHGMSYLIYNKYIDKNRGLLEGVTWQFEEENMKITLNGTIFVWCNYLRGVTSFTWDIWEKNQLFVKSMAF